MARGIMTIVIVTMLMDVIYGLALKCNCNCPGSQLVCGKDPKTEDLQTFKNPCQMICQNCTHSEKWMIIKQGECDKPPKAKRRSLNPVPATAATSKIIPATTLAKPTSKLLSKLETPARVKTALSTGG